MSLTLQLTIILILLILLLSIRKYARIKAKRKYRTTIFGAITKPLIGIHLKVDLAPGWIKSKAVESIIKDFQSINFVPARSYTVYEVEGLKLHSLFLDNYAAMIVNHPTEGIWVEICYKQDHGKFYIATNSPIGDEFNTHDDIKKSYKREASAIGLFNLLKHETAHYFATPITDDNFKPVIEEYYRKEISWKNDQGGVKIREFKNNIKNVNARIKITKPDLRRVFLEMKVDELHHWHDASIMEHRDLTNQKGTKFDYLEYALFIVPKKTISAAYLEYLSSYDIIKPDVKDKLTETFRKKTDIQKIFEIINNAFPDNRRAQCVGEVTFPLTAKIYRRGN